MKLPSDCFLLLSVLNTKLRDRYANLAELCEEEEADEAEIVEKMNEIGYVYDEKTAQFRQK